MKITKVIGLIAIITTGQMALADSLIEGAHADTVVGQSFSALSADQPTPASSKAEASKKGAKPNKAAKAKKPAASNTASAGTKKGSHIR